MIDKNSEHYEVKKQEQNDLSSCGLISALKTSKQEDYAIYLVPSLVCFSNLFYCYSALIFINYAIQKKRMIIQILQTLKLFQKSKGNINLSENILLTLSMIINQREKYLLYLMKIIKQPHTIL